MTVERSIDEILELFEDCSLVHLTTEICRSTDQSTFYTDFECVVVLQLSWHLSHHVIHIYWNAGNLTDDSVTCESDNRIITLAGRPAASLAPQ